MRIAKRICVLCSLIVLTVVGVFAQQPISQSFGVNIDFTDARPGELQMLSQGGFRWVRMDLKWDATEIERDNYDFSAYDRLMSSLEQENVRALFILDYGNPLYDH